MADWTDGAQYAPLERPDAFAMPSASPLQRTVTAPSLAEGRPDVAPVRYASPPDTVALHLLEPARGPQRDPEEPFADETSGSGWGAVHADWRPTMPLGEPDPDEPGGSFPPPAGPPTVASTDGVDGGAALPLGEFPPPTGAPVAFPPPADAQGPGGSWPPPPAVLPGPVAQDPYALPVSAPHDPYVALPAPPTPRPDQLPPAPGPTQSPTQPWQQLPPPQHGQALSPPRNDQSPARRPNLVADLVMGLGPVMLGALVLGVLWPGVSVIALVIASWLTTRTRLGLRIIRPAFSGAFLVLMVGWLSTLAGTPIVDYDVLGRVICIVLLVTSLAAGWSDLSRRR